MPSISVPAAIIGAGVLGAGASIIGGMNSANAAKSAAQIQANAANTASQNTLNEFNQTQANLAPFVGAGTNALTELQGLTGTNPGGNPLTAPLTAPFNPSNLQNTPGYQFALSQGEQSVINGAAAQGLGGGVMNTPAGPTASPSGALGKGLINYATGAASTLYQQMFQNYLQQNQQIYNQLSGIASTGENAAAMTGQQGLTATGQAGNFSTAGAAAQAAGTVGAASSVNSALGGVANSGSSIGLALALNNSGLFGGGGSGLSNSDFNGLTDAQIVGA